MLSAERHFTIARRLHHVYMIAHAEVPAADDIETGRNTPMVFTNTRRRARHFVQGDTFTSLSGIVGVLTPIEWEVVETTPRDQLLADRRGRFQVVSKFLQRATITIALNICEDESTVCADLFVLINEALLSGGLQHSFMLAVEQEIDSVISIAKAHFAVLEDVVVDENYPRQGPSL